MRINSEQLAGELERRLRPVYLLSGDEHLLMSEALDAIKKKARDEGFDSVETFTALSGFDWEQVTAAWRSPGLFAARNLIDLRVPGRFDKAGSDCVKQLVANSSPDQLLILSRPQMDKRALNTAWVRAFEEVGAHVRVWPLEAARLPRWLDARMRRVGLEPEPEAVTWLAQRVEGNLLAAAQEVDKLRMLRGPGPVSRLEVERYVADSSRFDVFKVSDAALAGDAARALRMICRLRAEGVAPVPLSWSLGRDVRLLSQLRHAIEAGQSTEPLFRRNGVWDSRKRLLQRAMRRRPAAVWGGLVARCAHLDQVSKGQVPGDPWIEAEKLVLELATS